MDDKDSEEKKEVRCFIAEGSDRFNGSPVSEEREEFNRRFDHMMKLNGGKMKIFSDRTEIIIVVVMWILVFLFGC